MIFKVLFLSLNPTLTLTLTLTLPLQAADAEGNTPLLLAVKEKNINIALYLLKELEGADLDGEDVLSLVNRSNNDDATALILASKGGMTEVCTKLLSMGANPGHQDFGDNDSLAMMGAPQKHFTPLHYAVKGKNMALCQIFLDYMRQGQGLWGCDLTVIRDENGMQPWQVSRHFSVQKLSHTLTRVPAAVLLWCWHFPRQRHAKHFKIIF